VSKILFTIEWEGFRFSYRLVMKRKKTFTQAQSLKIVTKRKKKMNQKNQNLFIWMLITVYYWGHANLSYRAVIQL